MHNIFKVAFLTLLLGMFSCGEDFLQTTPQQNVDIKDAVKDIKSLRTALNGLYSNLQDDDLYGRTMVLLPDLMADNVFISAQNAGRYLPHNEYRVLSTDAYYEESWMDTYEVVVNANNVIGQYPNAEFLSSEEGEAEQLLGETYALRALAYFNLVRMYAQPYNYTDDASHAGVPLVLELSEGKIIEPERATVAEVYDAIVADLEKAAELMTLDEDGRMTADAAKALHAKVALYMEDWTTAEQLATEVIESGNYTLYDATTWVDSWNSDFNSESIFEVVNTPVDNPGTNSIGYFFLQDGYGDGLATEDLYNTYSETDVRREVIEVGSRTDGEDVAYLIFKYPRGTNPGDDNIKVLRLAEMYLIRAEARAELGDEAGALEDLNAVAMRVDPNATAITASGDDLIDAILLERRKELAFEGDRLYDLTRRKRTFTKFLSADSMEIAYPSDQTVGPIPQAELDANPNATQNQGY